MCFVHILNFWSVPCITSWFSYIGISVCSLYIRCYFLLWVNIPLGYQQLHLVRHGRCEGQCSSLSFSGWIGFRVQGDASESLLLVLGLYRFWFAPLPQTHTKEGTPRRTSHWLDAEPCFVPKTHFPYSSQLTWWRVEEGTPRKSQVASLLYISCPPVRVQSFPVDLLWLVLGWGSDFLSWKGTLTNNDQAGGERKHHTEKVVP